MSDLMLFSGNANSLLSQKISECLGIPMSEAIVGSFSDGETRVEIHENVRGKDVFIIQPSCPPVNNNLMELVVIADALQRSSAGRITAVVPYFGYARQDRRIRSARVPITARLAADMLAMAGIDRVVTVDIHAEQIQGFFHIPLDNIYATNIMLEYIQEQDLEDMVVVSPDMGGVVRARAFAKRLGCDLAIIDKRRPQANEAKVMNIIGDVRDRHCLIVDDIVDTAGTLCKAAEALVDTGAKAVSAYCVHPVLSGKALANVNNSVLTELVVSDSIPLSEEIKACNKIKQLSLSPLLAETIKRINNEQSISSMFRDLVY